ncbi:M3 family metallopeptidase [Paramuribaculum intestinale]|uniref:M3 family metallopeptidase n=1 Tax=Paramuribaculum intestinale TaxID=2094151 RepID=UPI00272E0766|nr:M3 family metallopeptidase [Paramuribaculum intestinale]
MNGDIFMRPFDTPFGAVAFDKISNADYLPAFGTAIGQAWSEVEAIRDNAEAPTFANTIAALARSGEMLERVAGAFFPLTSACTDDEMMDISVKVSEMLTEHSVRVSLDEKLWQRIRSVHDSSESAALDREDRMLLKDTYEKFVRSGALLEGADREAYREAKKELSQLSEQFGQNLVKENAGMKIYLGADDLDGLPERLVEEAAERAVSEGRAGEYCFKLDFSVYSTFMSHSSRRDLRERFFRAYSSRNSAGEYSNLAIVSRMAWLRLKVARLLGYDTYADYALANKMARTRSNVDALLRRLKDAYMPVQRAEVDAITDFARVTEGDSFVTRQWDYAYYSRLYRISRYDYDPESMRPYFKLDTTVKGVFGLARTLYGIDFVKRHDIPVYHPDVEVYEVKDIDGSHLGLLYMDFFPRDGKRAGAWMTDFREQSMLPYGSDVRPHVSIVTNFTRPTSSTPALLSPNEVNTLLHEFGHALHSLFSRCRYAALSGTNVARDFVELPSQFNENFMRRREFLDTFARHYQTGEPLPDEAVEKMVRSSQFGCGYDCIRQLMFGLTDMAWHTVTEPVDDPVAFELSVTDAMAAIPNECRSVVSPSFGHIFSGGYAAGYYSYKWAEVIEADAFGRFLEEGVTNRRTAESFRREILEKGATDEPDELYRRFRGRDPEPEALLRRDGVIS